MTKIEVAKKNLNKGMTKIKITKKKKKKKLKIFIKNSGFQEKIKQSYDKGRGC